jgi:hypothetical protein
MKPCGDASRWAKMVTFIAEYWLMITKPMLGMLSVAILAAALPLASARGGELLFGANGTGKLTNELLSPTLLEETIDLSLTTSAGIPPLDTGVLTTMVDLTNPDVQTNLIDPQFTLTGPDGNGLLGTFGITSSVFNSLTETFTGVFDATGGTGAYAGYFGTGTFSGTNDFSDATLSTAVTTISISGALLVPEPSTLVLFGLGAAALAIGRVRQRLRANDGQIQRA